MWDKIAKVFGVGLGKTQRRVVHVEAVQLDAEARIFWLRERLDRGNGIRRRTQAHVPNDKRPLRCRRSFHQPLLPHVQRDRLDHRPDYRVKRLPVFPRPQAADAGLDGDEFKGGWVVFRKHGRKLRSSARAVLAYL